MALLKQLPYQIRSNARKANASFQMDRRRFLKFSDLGSIGVVISSYPFFIERYLIQVNNYQIPVPNLPPEFEGFRIVHLTDLHHGYAVPEVVIEHVVAEANALKGDIIVCTGDYVDKGETTKELDRVWPILSRLEAEYGVYSVLGNHDHYAHTARSLYWLNRSRQNLRHKSVAIELAGSRIWLGGAGDLWRDELGIDSAFEGVPEHECKILLAHNPDSADHKFSTRVDLVLSGHTHGGQINIPFLGTPVLPVKNRRYSCGFVRGRKTNVFISRGIGWGALPFRFNCSPEIAVLHLTQDDFDVASANPKMIS